MKINLASYTTVGEVHILFPKNWKITYFLISLEDNSRRFNGIAGPGNPLPRGEGAPRQICRGEGEGIPGGQSSPFYSGMGGYFAPEYATKIYLPP